MYKRGIYNRDGELLGYLEGTRIYNTQDDLTGTLHDQTVFDLDGERRWLIDGDAVLDLHSRVIGYLGERVTHDSW